MISVRQLSKSYGPVRALSEITFDVRPREVVILLGANGAGKSTLLQCLLGVTSYAGTIEVAGRDPLRAGRAVRQRIGYMPQTGGLHLDLSVEETLRLYAAIRRAPVARGQRLLADAGLGAAWKTRVAELSGGMRQRLAFVVAQLGDPPILLLDEPTASLDAASRDRLARLLRTQADAGKSVLVSTHSHLDLLDAADRVLLLEQGHLAADRPAMKETPLLRHVEPDVSPKPPTDGADRGTPALAPDSRRATADEPQGGPMRALVIKELRDALRNRWLAGYAGVLGALGLIAAIVGMNSSTGLALQMFGRTTATLMNLCLLLAPLIAVTMGATAIAGERDRGTLDHLLAQPLERRTLVLGKFVALLVSLAAATLAGFLPAGLLIGGLAAPGMLARYLLFPALAGLLGASMLGLGLVISVRSRSGVQAQGLALSLWFLFVLLYDLVLMGLLALSGVPADVLAVCLVANPVDATRVLGILALEPDLYLLGPAGALLVDQLSPPGAALLLLGTLALWTLMPPIVAVRLFRLPRRSRAPLASKDAATLPAAPSDREIPRVEPHAVRILAGRLPAAVTEEPRR